MAQTLREFISAREAEIKQQAASLKRELDELRAAKAAIDSAGATPPSEQKMTHRAMVRDALDEHPEGGTSEQVIAWVREKFGIEISRTSISSHLSRIKSEDGGAMLDNATKIWRSTRYLSPEVRYALDLIPTENGEPSGSSDADAEGVSAPPASSS